MTHSLKLAGAFVLAALLFSSCDKCDPTTTTQMDENDVKWLVYDRGEKVKFKNEAGDTVVYTNTILRAEQVPGEGFNTGDDCIEHFDVQAYSVIQDPEKDYPGLMTYFLKKENSFDVALHVELAGEYKIDTLQATHATYEINETTYNNVFEVVKTDSSKTENLKRLLFNKEHGFLGVELFNGKKLELLK
ncbi:hypothetical protein [uncultured Pontibacter sp.]|uniref:hypothetical protein n=1 Tax=uncultured Pontibacter sp. TaxID=453356 RepID=UPI002613DEB1|nr:hypothetical protein [uncultured Pontibacter sp.]